MAIGVSSPKANTGLAAGHFRLPSAAVWRPSLDGNAHADIAATPKHRRVEPRSNKTARLDPTRCTQQLVALPHYGKAIIRNHGHDADLDDFGQGCPRRQHGGKVRVALGGHFCPNGEFHGERFASGVASTSFVRICGRVARLRKDRAGLRGLQDYEEGCRNGTIVSRVRTAILLYILYSA